MKKIVFFIFSCWLLLNPTKGHSQCPSGDLNFTTQQQLDDFVIDYPSCSQITGNITIEGSSINDLSALSAITNITGNLQISNNSQLPNLEGLSNLSNIGGYLQINHNHQLLNLDELSGLTTIGGNLWLNYNNSLANLNGLGSLTSVGGDFRISNHGNLQNLNGVDALESIGGSFLVSINVNLYDINGFPSLTSIGGNFRVNSNIQSKTISGFNALTTLGGSLQLDLNIHLTTFNGFDSLTSIGGGFRSEENPLTTMNALSSLQSIGGGLIFTMSQLTHLDNFSALTSIAGGINLTENTLLTSLLGLANIEPTSITGLVMRYNYSLSFCNVASICTYLQGSGPRTISNNGTYCSNAATACSPPECPSGSISLTTQAQINTFASNYPNCTQITGNLYIQGANITNLTPLSNLTTVTQNFHILNNSLLTNLDGLSNLTSVGNVFRIDNNAILTDISGIENISPESFTQLQITNNPSLSICNIPNICQYLQGPKSRTISGNATGCQNVTVVGVSCITCPSPTNLTATNITDDSATLGWTSDGELFSIEWGAQGFTQGQGTIINNIETTSYTISDELNGSTQYQYYLRQDCTASNDGVSVWAGPYSFTTSSACPSGDLNFTSQSQINTFGSTYPNCANLLASLTISGNDITDLSAFSNLISVGGRIRINSNPALQNVDGFGALTTVGGDLQITSNNNLTQVDGFNSLTTIAGHLRLWTNPVLANLDGFSSLTSIGTHISLKTNNSLTDISGLQNIDPATIVDQYGIEIQNNPNLSVCNIPNFCEYLQGSGPRSVYGNASGCVSDTQINAYCAPCDAPTDLTATNITDDSATLGWTSEGELFTVEWGLQGFTQGQGTIINNIETTSYTILDLLNGSTQYDFYIRQDCTVKQSDWVGPFTFITPLSCPTGDVTLSSQIDIIDFIDYYPNCTQISGNLVISGSSNTDISPLIKLISISGNLNISNTEFPNLDGLSALTNVGGNLKIDQNFSLSNLDGLSTLTTVDGYLHIQNNNALTNIDGLSALTSVGGFLRIQNNNILTNIDGLSTLNSIGDFLHIQNNNALTNIDGLSALNSVGGYLYFYSNDALTNLDGLSALTSIGDFLEIESNNQLVNINGLSNINPTSITSLTIISNSNLSLCNINSVCVYLEGSGPKNINYNGAGCNSVAEVALSCIPCEVATDLSVSSITSNSAVLSWVSQGNLFDIEYGLEGFQQGTGTFENGIEATTFDLGSLSSDSIYDFYVRQDCSVKQSDWEGPFSFTTLPICPTGDIAFSTQAHIDAFGQNYPNCTQITGNVTISGSTITDLTPLSNILSIGGNLILQYNTNLNSLDGLNDLASIGGSLTFYINNSLINIDGLNSLTNIGNGLQIMLNNKLSNIDGFNSLTSIGGHLGIQDNSKLINVNGLSALTSIDGDLVILNNALLVDISGLQNINPNSIYNDIGYGLLISSNSQLSVCNLPNICAYLSHPSSTHPRTISNNAGDCITEVAISNVCADPCPEGNLLFSTQQEINEFGILYPYCSEFLYSITVSGADVTNLDGLNILQSVGGTLSITDNPLLSDLEGLNNIESVGGNFIVFNNDLLLNLNGLNSLQSIGGSINIEINPLLQNLNGLINLTSIGINLPNGGNIVLYNNQQLTDISGLQNVNPPTIGETYGIRIIDNPQLSLCNSANFCAYLQGSGPRAFAGNAGNCVNEAAVTQLCVGLCDAENVFFSNQQQIDEFEISYPDCTQLAGNITVSGTNITNLDGLSHLESVGGFVNIFNNPALINLDGLNNLQTIGGFLELGFNGLLQTINGLNNLQSAGAYIAIVSSGELQQINGFNGLLTTGGGINIFNNSSLITLEGFNALENIQGGGGLFFQNNTSLESIDAFASLESIDHGLFFINSALESINGFNSLQSIGLRLDINQNSQLQTINGFDSLESVGVGIYINYNPELQSINILNNSQNCSGDLFIDNNVKLEEIDGISSIQTVGGSVYFFNNPLITNLNHFSALKSIGGFLVITYNSLLQNLEGLDNLESIGGIFDVRNNNQLLSFEGLDNLQSIGADFEVFDNGQLLNFNGLNNLQSVGGNFRIFNNNELLNLNELTSLQSIGGSVNIENNPLLQNLNGLSNLTSIGTNLPSGGNLILYNNLQLSDITGLQNINPATIGGVFGIRIIDNAQLSVCNVANFCEYLQGSGPRAIAGNAGDCVSVAAVTAACFCETPSDLNIANITLNSATLAWTSDGDLFEVEWGGQGFEQGEGTTLTNIESNSILLDELQASTQYQFYVRKICQFTQSDWSGPYSFTTLLVCPTGNLTFTTQSEIDYFGANYGHCTTLSVNLTVQGAHITDLSALNNITSITGNLDILENPQLTNLDVLNSLTSVGGYFQIYANPELVSIDGFNGLLSIGSDLIIKNNSELITIDGLSTLTSIDRDFQLASNPELISLNGLSALTAIGGYLEIYEHQNLTDISGLQNIDPSTIGGEYGLYIGGNPNLPICNLPNFCTYLQGEGPRSIFGNAEDCESEEAVILACFPCEAPSDLSATIINPDSVLLSWESDAEMFEITWGEQGFDIDSGTTITNIESLSFLLEEGITNNVTYEFYVRTNCAFSQSIWEGPYSFVVFSTCPEGDVSFNSQAQLDAFGVNYLNCTEISGHLTVQGNDITDLSALNDITTVTGNFRIINNPQLTNLPAFSALTNIGGNILINNNSQLVSFNSLNALTIIGEYIKIGGNAQLSTFDGFNSLISITDYIEIYNNPELTNFGGFDALTTIGGHLMIIDHLELTQIDGFSSLTSVAGNFTININPKLVDIDSFASLTSVGEVINIYNNPELVSIEGLSALTSVTKYILIDTNLKLTSLNGLDSLTDVEAIYINNLGITSLEGLGSLTNVQDQFHVLNNQFITSIEGIDSLTSVGKDILIMNNAILTNVDGLIGITSVGGGYLAFESNPMLTDISGAINIDPSTIGGEYGLYIVDNPLLTVCNLPNLCTYLQGTEARTIEGNAGDCISEEAINGACDLSGNCDTYTIWNGSIWSNSEPNSNTKAIIEGNLTISEDLTTCELLLNSGVLTVASGVSLTVNGLIENTQNQSNFIVQSGANLIQLDDVENIGAITVQRNAVIKHLDYTVWSSPVAIQGLQAFSPYTLSSRIRIYNGAPAVNNWVTTTGDFVAGKGYMFRAPNVFDDGFYPNAYTWTGNFKGVPQNGVITAEFTNLGNFQSVGNPYPSNIDREAFHQENPNVGALYFWTNTFGVDVNGNYLGNNWKVVNTLGDSVSPADGSNEPLDYISVGQGFLARTYNDESQVVFNNEMRTSTNSTFFKSITTENHKYWLNLQTENQTLNQMLVSYNENSTNNLDFGIDSSLFNYSGSAIYSLIENSEEKFAIQGRALPFNPNDIVPLGFKATQAGNYSVSLANFDGLFAEGQNIYLRDKFTQVEHDLKASNYEFVSEQGTFNERFEVVYTTQSLSVDTLNLENSWIVYNSENSFNILTQGFEMKDVVVYDMLGRVVYSAKDINSNQHQFQNLGANQVLIVKITTSESEVLTKKILN